MGETCSSSPPLFETFGTLLKLPSYVCMRRTDCSKTHFPYMTRVFQTGLPRFPFFLHLLPKSSFDPIFSQWPNRIA